MSLANYSEFGLIVASIAVGQNLLSPDWLMIIAITVSISFAISSPLSTHSEAVYNKFFGWLKRFERDFCHPSDAPIDLGTAKAVIFGMGRIGIGAYDELTKKYGANDLCGIEHVPERVDFNREQGRKVYLADACDTEFWQRLHKELKLELIVLAMPNHQSNMYAARQIRNMELRCQVAGIAHFPEEVEELSEIGICTAYNMYDQAGAGLARKVMEATSCKLF